MLPFWKVNAWCRLAKRKLSMPEGKRWNMALLTPTQNGWEMGKIKFNNNIKTLVWGQSETTFL